jgi:hypothetical protein
LDDAIAAEGLRKELERKAQDIKLSLDHQYMLDVDENDPFVEVDVCGEQMFATLQCS